MNTQTVTINLVPGLSTPPVVNVKQGDIGRPIAFRVMDGTSAATLPQYWSAKVEGTKPSGLGFSETCTISGNTVTVSTTEEMTQECGRIPAEISFTHTGVVIGTANFILAVERDPHPENVTDGTYETMDDIQTQVNALDTRVTALEAGSGGSGLTDDIKTALLQIAQKVAYIDAHGQDYYDDLYDALYSSTTRSVLLVLSHVSSSNTQSTVEVGDSYTTTLTASTNYTLNTVTVNMGGVDVTSTTYSSGTVSIPSVTGNIVITASAVLAAQSITATYTQSGTVYDTDSLDSLKADLVVTANYSGGTSETVPASNYTLSGTLTVGTSTVTVNYAGLTDTFSVTVSHAEVGLLYSWDFTQSLVDSIAGKEVTLAGNATRDSSGLKITAATDYASADVGMTSGRRIEIDIASYTRGNSSSHGRLITHSRVSTSQFDCGVVWRSSNVLSLYEGSWNDSSVTDINDLTGKTLGYEFNGPDAGSSTVYLDGTQVATISHSTFANVVDTVELGSQSGQSGFILTVTAMRVYELTQ